VTTLKDMIVMGDGDEEEDSQETGAAASGSNQPASSNAPVRQLKAHISIGSCSDNDPPVKHSDQLPPTEDLPPAAAAART
jgi:hypothetical protein